MINDLQNDQFDFDPTAGYADQGATILPDPGEYTVRVTSMKRKVDKATQEPVMVDGEFPVLTLNRIEVVEPEDDNATYAVFADVGTKPFARKVSKSKTVGASKALDLVRALDVNLYGDVEDYAHALDVAEAAINGGTTFRVKLGYKAVDFDNVKATQREGMSSEEVRELWNKNTYYTKAFRNANGKGYQPSVVTPDNKTLQAKLVIDSFVASDKHGKLGAF